MKNVILISLILIPSFVFAQDWIVWFYTYKFKIDSKSNLYNIKNMDFYINDYDVGSVTKSLKYSPETEEYTLHISHGCISCGHQYQFPPDVYILVGLEDKYFPEEKSFSTFIPVYANKNIGASKIIDLGTIKLSDFVDGYTEENGKSLPPYEAIEVMQDYSIVKRRKGEYQIKRMDKLIKIELSKY
ncbi:MAG: hypothetical protein E2590_01185 [Chryseobacterium sp.]|nr:hypothetical protein [Chryseobacterium sp.]